MSSKIVARGVRMDYTVRNDAGQTEEVAVLRDFDLDIRDGEFLSVLGPSGCGKSTFLSILAGLTERTGGNIRIDGHALAGINPHQGVVFQGYALFPWRTVLENIEVGLEIRGVPKAERRRIAQEHLELVGLTGAGARYPHEISGGMKQRVAIARALAMRPELILFDEVTSALDPETVGEVLNVIGELVDDGLTCVLVTHEMAFARAISDEVVFTEHGVVVERGSAEQVFSSPTSDRTRAFLSRALSGHAGARPLLHAAWHAAFTSATFAV